MSQVATLGRALPGLIFEAVRDPVHHNRLLLHAHQGRKFDTQPRLYDNATTFVPPTFARRPDSVSAIPQQQYAVRIYRKPGGLAVNTRARSDTTMSAVRPTEATVGPRVKYLGPRLRVA
jgi:hypothetical protein